MQVQLGHLYGDSKHCILEPLSDSADLTGLLRLLIRLSEIEPLLWSIVVLTEPDFSLAFPSFKLPTTGS